MSSHLGERAAAFVDGALRPDEQRRLAAHVEGCPDCGALVADQARIRELLRASADGTETVRPGLLEALVAVPAAGSGPETLPWSTGGQTPNRWGAGRSAIAVAAVGALTLASAWSVGGPAAAGSPALSPERLVAQHEATAGAVPIWGSAGGAAPAWGMTDRDDPVAVLRTAVSAQQAVSYRAVERVTGSPDRAAATVDVVHLAGEGTARGDRTTSFVPDRWATAPGSGDALALLATAYELTVEAPVTVAGRPTDVVVVSQRGGSAVARFWVDRATGLLLARERLLGGAASRTEVATLDLTGPDEAPAGHVPAALDGVRPLSVTAVDLRTLSTQGWVCPGGSVAGLTALAARHLVAGERAVLHLVYSDGLRSVSVFQERGDLVEPPGPGWTRTAVAGQPVWRLDGPQVEATWVSGDLVLTVVGDPAVVDDVVSALPHEGRPADDALTRTGRGMARVGSWFDPFG